MRKLLISAIVSLALAPSAHADDQADPLAGFLKEQGLLNKIESVGTKVESKTSELVVNAMSFLGIPYKRGGNNADSGFDCSGFVRAIYEQTAGLVLPRRADQQAAATQAVDKTDMQPGDLVFFNTMRRAFSHVGIYLGEGKFIHSPKPGAQVRVEDMHSRYWERRFNGARRVEASDPIQAIAATAQTKPAAIANKKSLPSAAE